ncbi:MAG TPA: DUF1800 family protein [Rudaea sp.]|nr:DUF1800 family protein [Rudaea sp.]
MKVWTSLAAVAFVAASPLATASVHDHIFGNHFDIIPDLPATTNDAARFLTQATFGPVTADVTRLMQIGYSEWIDEQIGLRPTLEYATVEAVKNAHAASTSQSYRLNRWYWQAVYAPDQLRQRMAFALSQIFVVSDQSSAIGQDNVPMSAYQDMLANDAFGNYGTVLNDVTYSPTMGKFLNAFHNVAPICSGSGVTLSCSTSADENYAREVMQLFSVGLVLLNMDGSHVTGDIPTYDQSIITNTAQVFTGFTYGDAPTGIGSGAPPANFFGGGSTDAGASLPMECFGNEYFSDNNPQMKHDVNGDGEVGGVALTVLGTNGMPSNTQIPNTVTPGTCAAEVADELSIIASHPNVPPFISRQLIQRFVTSNPSPQYIQRVATVMDAPGKDLGDVIKAILTDTEARNPPALNTGDTYGKLREPVLRLTAMWRAFNAKAPAADTFGEIKMIGGGNFQNNFGENPLESPTVFNFFSPDFQQPGTLSDNNLYSPEFEITNASTTYTGANTYFGFTAQGYQGFLTGNPLAPPTDRPLIDLSSLTQNATTDTQVNVPNMVSTINTSMLYGTMSAAMNTSLSNMLTQLKSGGTGGPTEMAWSAIYVTMLSPEYATQR